MVRLILLLLAAILYLILTLPVLFILWLIGKKNPNLRERAASAMIRWIFRVLLAEAGVKVTVIGQDRIPSDTAVLYVGNHRSIFDIILTYVRSPRATGYVAKKELGKIPLFSQWARYIGCLFFNRNDIKEGMKMILDGVAMLKAGKSVFIFPEGTRNKNESDLPLLPFRLCRWLFATRSISGKAISPGYAGRMWCWNTGNRFMSQSSRRSRKSVSALIRGRLWRK